jgi:heme oxygenase
MSNEPMERTGRAGGARQGLMARLRAETRELHGVTERTPFARAIYEGGVDRAQYAHLLRFMRVALARLEEAAATSPEPRVRAVFEGVDSKLPWLDHDLRVLGEPARAPTAREVEATGALLSEIDDAARDVDLLALLYVFEGSTTGGQFLASRLETNARIPADAIRFYRGNGPTTGDRFRAFGARLEAAVKDELECRRVVRRAQGAFERIRACFEAIGHRSWEH